MVSPRAGRRASARRHGVHVLILVRAALSETTDGREEDTNRRDVTRCAHRVDSNRAESCRRRGAVREGPETRGGEIGTSTTARRNQSEPRDAMRREVRPRVVSDRPRDSVRVFTHTRDPLCGTENSNRPPGTRPTLDRRPERKRDAARTKRRDARRRSKVARLMRDDRNVGTRALSSATRRERA